MGYVLSVWVSLLFEATSTVRACNMFEGYKNQSVSIRFALVSRGGAHRNRRPSKPDPLRKSLCFLFFAIHRRSTESMESKKSKGGSKAK